MLNRFDKNTERVKLQDLFKSLKKNENKRRGRILHIPECFDYILLLIEFIRKYCMHFCLK